MHAVRADACDDAGAGFGFPDLVARMAVKAVEAAAARGVDGIVRHGRREIAVAFADGSRPGDLRADHFTEVLQVRRFVLSGVLQPARVRTVNAAAAPSRAFLANIVFISLCWASRRRQTTARLNP